MRTVVVGGGVAGLVAALVALDRGYDVVLLEAGERLGGRIAPVGIDGIVVDGGAESFAVRGGSVASLLERIGLAADVVDPVGSAWVALADRTVPLPAGGLLGIPSSPLAADVRAVLGTSASVRAHLDRVIPPVKVGRYEYLGPLVRGRMGRAVLDRLVAPVVESVYGVHPDEAPVDAIAPGLNSAITAAGALSAAVLRLRMTAPPGSAAQGVAGGVHRVPGAIAAHLRRRGADLRTSVAVRRIRPEPGGGHVVVAGEEELVTDRLVIATDGAAALALLAEVVPGLAELPPPHASVTRTVLLTVDDVRLDAAPRGTGVLRAAERGDVTATAITHASAKWAWIADLLPPHRHLLRLAYRGEARPDDRTVHADAAALLGVGLAATRERVDVVWTDSAPALAPRTRALRRAAAAGLPDGVAVEGSWAAGTGIASVVAHARPGTV